MARLTANTMMTLTVIRGDAPRHNPPARNESLRGVYIQPYLVKGHREVYAVDSHGEQVAVRYVKKGQDTRPAEIALWGELDELDPAARTSDAPAATTSLQLLDQ